MPTTPGMSHQNVIGPVDAVPAIEGSKPHERIATTIPMPPPRGVGAVWERRKPGASIRFRRWAYAIDARVTSAETASAAPAHKIGADAPGTIVYSPTTPWIGRTVPQFLQLGHCQ
jgi:hypothetical protein